MRTAGHNASDAQLSSLVALVDCCRIGRTATSLVTTCCRQSDAISLVPQCAAVVPHGMLVEMHRQTCLAHVQKYNVLPD